LFYFIIFCICTAAASSARGKLGCILINFARVSAEGCSRAGGARGSLVFCLLPKQQNSETFESQSPSTWIFFYTTSLQRVCLSTCTCSPADTCPSCCCCTPGAWACRRLAARAASDALSAAAASASRSALSPKKPRQDPATRTIENCYRTDFENMCLSPGVVSSGPATEILQSQCPKTFTI
jgi:hypothetical protein